VPAVNWRGFRRPPDVAGRRARTARDHVRLAKSGRKLTPIVLDGRTICRSFWGRAWCENLESYRDFEYRLPRGRSYLRSGAVLDLDVAPGRVSALVSGTSLYEVCVTVEPLPAQHWQRIRTRCAGQVGSLIELLEGRLSDRVMRVVTDRAEGLFPKPAEIQMHCSCPDWAAMCKHVAAALYGVGGRLDTQPELLFRLRGVDHAELIAEAASLDATRTRSGRKTLADDVLSDVFGIELEPVELIGPGSKPPKSPRPPKSPKSPKRPKPPHVTGRGPTETAGAGVPKRRDVRRPRRRPT